MILQELSPCRSKFTINDTRKQKNHVECREQVVYIIYDASEKLNAFRQKNCKYFRETWQILSNIHKLTFIDKRGPLSKDSGPGRFRSEEPPEAHGGYEAAGKAAGSSCGRVPVSGETGWGLWHGSGRGGIGARPGSGWERAPLWGMFGRFAGVVRALREGRRERRGRESGGVGRAAEQGERRGLSTAA